MQNNKVRTEFVVLGMKRKSNISEKSKRLASGLVWC